MNTPARILLVDGQTLFREGLRCLLSKHPDLSVVGEAPNGRVATTEVEKTRPDIVLTEMDLPVFTGLDLMDNFAKLESRPRTVILTQKCPDVLIKWALRAGAAGYFLKTEPASILIRGLRDITRGRQAYSPTVSRRLSEICSSVLQSDGTKELSRKELQVIRCLGSGLTCKQTAQQLGVSPKTVDSHREHINKKLGVRGAYFYVMYSIEHGLIDPPQRQTASSAAA